MKPRFCDSRGSISFSAKPARPGSPPEQLLISLQYRVQQALQHRWCLLHGWSFLCWVSAWTECKVASSAIKWPARLSIRKTSLSIKTPETSGLVRRSFFPFLLVPRWPGLALPCPGPALRILSPSPHRSPYMRVLVSFPPHHQKPLHVTSRSLLPALPSIRYMMTKDIQINIHKQPRGLATHHIMTAWSQ